MNPFVSATLWSRAGFLAKSTRGPGSSGLRGEWRHPTPEEWRGRSAHDQEGFREPRHLMQVATRESPALFLAGNEPRVPWTYEIRLEASCNQVFPSISAISGDL